jgi:hypothetical protein|tara:strand:- start:1209 stop:1484 length:276 start_codon:yes stop_codon:yes gene_type:complete
MDGRKNNGGHSTKGFAGRKPKSEEIKLIEKLSPLDDLAMDAMRKGLEKGNFQFVQLYFHYCHGKPKDTVDLNTTEMVNHDFKKLVGAISFK